MRPPCPQTIKTLTAVLAIALSSCKTRDPVASQVKSVGIAQTDVKSQGRSNFCWAYALIAFLEAEYFGKTGEILDLSEEALGFYRMAEELSALSKKYPAAELTSPEMVKAKVFEGLQGWSFAFGQDSGPNFDVPDAYQLVAKYGVVPESAWRIKLVSPYQNERLLKSVFVGFSQLVQKQGPQGLSLQEIFKLLASKDAFGSEPPSTFTLTDAKGQKREVSAVAFARESLGFRPENYRAIHPSSEVGYDEIIAAIKQSLAQKTSVVMGFDTYFIPSARTEDSLYILGSLDPKNLDYKDSHAGLITDFVNKGDSPGDLGPERLAKVMASPASAIDYIVLKDSLRPGALSTRIGRHGYLPMDQNYLRHISGHPTRMMIMVPSEVADTIIKR